MVMRKTSDAALISISQKDKQRFLETIDDIKSARWKHTYSKKHNKILLRRRATRRWNATVAADLEDSLAKNMSKRANDLVWAWSDGGDELYFPGTEIMVLFKEGTSQAERKRILGKIKGLQVQTYQDAEVKPPVRPKKRRSRRPPDFPGFAKSKASQYRAIWQKMHPELGDGLSHERPAKVMVPVAKVTIPDSRRDEVFELARRIKALPKVRAATPEVSVIGKDVLGRPQQADLPTTSNDSVVELNGIDFAWRLINPDDVNAPSDVFLASRERVAVIDWTFHDHPKIDFEWIGYDVADHDYDPRSPQIQGAYPHGFRMSGVIGGQAQEGLNQTGIAAGAVIVPLRPSWSTEDDFEEINGQVAYVDFEEFVERYTSNWIDTLIRLYELSYQGVETANMSIALNSQLWDNATTDLSEWFNWWLREGNSGGGVFASASAGNNPSHTSIAIPAKVSRVFAVGWGIRETYTMLGNSGWGLELVVDDGEWPYYLQDGTVSYGTARSGGSSVASAVVAATVALMKTLNPYLNADEIKAILRLTTHKIPFSIAAASSPFPLTGGIVQWPDEDAWDGWGSGYCNEFGNGFLDAYYAAELAWRRKRPAAELLRVKFHYDFPARAMIQLRHPPYLSLAGKRTGLFCSSFSYSSTATQRWLHDSSIEIEGADQTVDLWGLPFGEKILVGDFDGDYVDELALQLHNSEFWPDYCDHPPQSFVTFKFDEADERWKSMGKRSPYASGAASPEVVFPPEQPPRDMLVADLKGDRKDCLIAWGGEIINALQYDEASDTFRRLDPVNFNPPLYSSAIDQATGQGMIVSQEILKVTPIKRGSLRERLMIVGTFSKFGTGAILGTELGQSLPASFDPYENLPHLPGTYDFSDFEPSGSSGLARGQMALRHYMTFSILGYDENTSQWVNYAFSSSPNDTHILLDESSVSYVESVFSGEFAYPGNASLNEVVIHLANDHLHTLLFANAQGGNYNLNYIYKNELNLEGRVSRLRAGRFGFDGDRTQLAWLDDEDHGNRVRFLVWNEVMREWQPDSRTINHGRPDNHAIDLAVLEGFTFAGLDGDQAVIALLMAEPDANVYHTYRYQDPGAFYFMGLV